MMCALGQQLRAGDYGSVVFSRWDIALGVSVLNFREDLGDGGIHQFSSASYAFGAGINLPVLYSDSSLFTVGLNPSVSVTDLSRGSFPTFVVSAPLLLTLKVNNDAHIRPPSGWHIGGTLGGGVMYNAILPTNGAETLSDVIPTVMAEINIGKRKSGFPGLLKLRYTQPLGTQEHFNGTLTYTMTNVSLIYTTGF
ncbi:MAG TPA: hypothetical protein DIS79_07430 [Bacteroidetes bacterium]|nr:hypothetical protein [Bacteroidota bacterium]